MRIFPAIDLIGGKAVRLEKGDYTKKTEYYDDPAEVAKEFRQAGADYIHIVDLDGAKAKQPVNTDVIERIAKTPGTSLQVGGGIRSLDSAAKVLKYADRVIIGTVAITKPQILKELLNRFGSEKVIVSVDYKNGKPAVNGWLETAELTTGQLKERMLSLGVKTIIVTDADKDGLLAGPNIKLMKDWKQAGFEIICAGGVSSLNDIRQLKTAGIDGAIIGKALYEKKIDLRRAINAD
jgi:phosphoribosylformimino-5-aminoimidazole carboxamide ribotide isomerase